MTSYVVTGASRGIGLGFVKQLLERPNSIVFAIVRNKAASTDLQALAGSAPNHNVHVVQADLTDLSSIKAAAAEVSEVTGGKLDVLINNAALMKYERSFATLDQFPSNEVLEQDMTLMFKTNVIGVTHTINAFLPLIQAGNAKKIFTISSSTASTKYVLDGKNAASFPYSISKAAVNMAVTKFALTYTDITFLSVSPGVVKTMQGPEEQVKAMYAAFDAQMRKKNPNWPGAITVEDSVRSQLALFDAATVDMSGQFVNRYGGEVTSFT